MVVAQILSVMDVCSKSQQQQQQQQQHEDGSAGLAVVSTTAATAACWQWCNNTWDGVCRHSGSNTAAAVESSGLL
jgi:hypothetical protein